MNGRKDAWGYVLGHRTGKKTAGKIYTSADVEHMLLITAMMERIEPSIAPADAKSTYPADLIIHKHMDAYGYTDAKAVYQPTQKDVSMRDRLEPVLVEALKAMPDQRMGAVLARYRLKEGGVEDQDQLMEWHIVAPKIGCKTAERAAAYAEEAMQWMAERLGRGAPSRGR